MITLRITAERGIDRIVFPPNLNVQIFCQCSSVALLNFCARLGDVFVVEDGGKEAATAVR